MDRTVVLYAEKKMQSYQRQYLAEVCKSFFRLHDKTSACPYVCVTLALTSFSYISFLNTNFNAFYNLMSVMINLCGFLSYNTNSAEHGSQGK